MTTRGRTLLALGLSMLVFGRLAGMRELIIAGAAIGLILVAGTVVVWARRGRVTVERSIAPNRTVAGTDVKVRLTIRADGALGTGPLLLTDTIPKRLGTSVRLALPAGFGRRERSVTYAFAPRLRGRYAVGPIEITHTDPFGAMQRRRKASGTSTLVVYPPYEAVSVLPSGVHRLGVIRHSPLVGQGDEFYALRPYEEGDDLRKVHWPSSLRKGDLVIRQEELLAEPRALVVLDTCGAKHKGSGVSASIEAAVSACASIAVLAMRRRMRVEVLTSDGPLLQIGNPSEHQLLEALAVLRPSSRRDLVRAAEQMPKRRPAVSVIITPGINPSELRALALLTRGTVGGAVVEIDAASFADGTARRRQTARLTALGLPIVPLAAGQSFRVQWQGVIRDVALAK